MIRQGLLFLSLVLVASGQQVSPAFQWRSGFQAQSARGDADYQRGMSELDSRQWDDAVHSFEASAAHNKANADAALYWKAYALNRGAHTEAALAAITELRDKYPSSRWLRDARALDLEIRGRAGDPVNPNAVPDEELKVIALNSLMQSEPKQALPILEHLLTGNQSEKIKNQALFVLAQNDSPDYFKVLGGVAHGSAGPDLQIKAIHFMGMMNNSSTQSELVSIYNSSSDTKLKRAILQSFMQSGSRDLLLRVAKTDSDPEMRRDAYRQLAITGGQDQLWQLYQSEPSVDNKRAILQSLFLTGDASRLLGVAQSEKNPQLQIAAIRSLGLMGKNGNPEALAGIYRKSSDHEVRTAVINALFLQGDGKALVDLARTEKDPEMKAKLVNQMALIHSKEVTDYLEDILK